METLDISVQPQILRFTPVGRQQVLYISNNNKFAINYELKCKRLENGKSILAADRLKGTIPPGSTFATTIEFRGETTKPDSPIVLEVFSDKKLKITTREVPWVYDAGSDSIETSKFKQKPEVLINQYLQSAPPKRNERENVWKTYSLDDYIEQDDPMRNPPPPLKNERTIEEKVMKTTSIVVFAISLINFVFVFYMTYLSPIDSIWKSQVKEYKLEEIALKCSSWYEISSLIHNMTCPAHSY